MNFSKKKIILAPLIGLAATVAVLFLLSTFDTRAATLTASSTADSSTGALQGHKSLLSALSIAATGSAQMGSVPCLNTSSTLEDLIHCISGYMPHTYSVDGRDGFDVPTVTEMTQWREVVGQMMEGECDAIDLSGYAWGDDFTVTTFTDTQNNHTYCVFAETRYEIYTTTQVITRVTYGWGTFIYNPAYLRELNISAPHARYETGTATEAVGILKNTRSRTFLMTGAHRHASNVTSTCQSGYQRSDAAHNTDHMFHATVEELVEYYDSHNSQFYHLQFHGMSSCCGVCDVHLSHGSNQPPVPGDRILELRDNLLAHHPGWSICVSGGPCGLDGTENVQGRLLNGVPPDQVCDIGANGYSGYFIHIEQCLGYRDPDDWFPAINDTWAPRLAVTKRADPDPVLAGAQLTYTLRVTNTGDTRLHATIADVLPAHITPGTTFSGTLILPGGTLTWPPVVVAPGGVWTQQVVVTVAMSYSGTLTNVVRVTTEEGATGAYTETSRALVTPMLEVSKQADPSPVLSGALLTFTLLVTNTGNVTLTAIITDILPDHVSPTGVLTWMAVITAPGGVWTEAVVVTAETDYEGPLTNVVLATTDEGATGTASVTVCVNTCKIYLPIVLKNYPSVDLLVSKTDNPDPVVAGSSLTYILTVNNAGPSDATGVQLTDDLPSGVTFVSVTPSQGSCNHAGGTVTCNLSNIADGSSATVTIEVTVAPSTIGMLNNSANVTGNETDLAPGNNAVSVTTMVNAEVDITGIMCRVAVEDVAPLKIWLHQRHIDAHFTRLGLTPPFDAKVRPICPATGDECGNWVSLPVDSFDNSIGMIPWEVCDVAMKKTIRQALCAGDPGCDLDEIVYIEPPEQRPPRTLRFVIEGE